MSTIRLTMAQALVRYLAAQKIETEQGVQSLFEGVFAIFGHGNVAGMGEALYQYRDSCLPSGLITNRAWHMPPSPSPRPIGAGA